MDFTTIIGVIALMISIASLWQGWRSDTAVKKLSDDFNRTNHRQANQNERQADQIDALIEVTKLLIARL